MLYPLPQVDPADHGERNLADEGSPAPNKFDFIKNPGSVPMITEPSNRDLRSDSKQLVTFLLSVGSCRPVPENDGFETEQPDLQLAGKSQEHHMSTQTETAIHLKTETIHLVA